MTQIATARAISYRNMVPSRADFDGKYICDPYGRAGGVSRGAGVASFSMARRHSTTRTSCTTSSPRYAIGNSRMTRRFHCSYYFKVPTCTLRLYSLAWWASMGGHSLEMARSAQYRDRRRPARVTPHLLRLIRAEPFISFCFFIRFVRCAVRVARVRTHRPRALGRYV